MVESGKRNRKWEEKRERHLRIDAESSYLPTAVVPAKSVGGWMFVDAVRGYSHAYRRVCYYRRALRRADLGGRGVGAFVAGERCVCEVACLRA